MLEYLLKQETVLVNAVDRFGGTPFMDAVRHERKGAAALLEEAGCVRDTDAQSKDVLREMIERSNMKKEARLRAEREPKIRHVLDNSQESKMVATISDKLSKEIAAQSEGIEIISRRLIWGLRGFGTRLQANDCNIPFSDRTFVKSAEHVLKLVNEMRASVNASRSSLTAEMQGDEGAADCLIWRNASKEYKRQASDLDNQMRELIMLAKVSKRMLKEVIKVCKRGSRQDMYADNHMKAIMASAMLDKNKLIAQEEVDKAIREQALAGSTGPTDKISWWSMPMSLDLLRRGSKQASSRNLTEQVLNREHPSLQSPFALLRRSNSRIKLDVIADVVP